MLVSPRSRMRLIAVLRRAAMTWGPWPVRTLEWSSPSVTSRTQCRQFSMVQCERIQSASSRGSASRWLREVIAYTVSTEGWPGRARRLRLLRQPLPLLLGTATTLMCTPAGLPVTWALAYPKLDERQVLMAVLDHDTEL